MANIRPKILIRYGRQNEPIRVPISDLLVDPVAQTFITTTTVSGLNVLTVKGITGFAVNQILLIGEPGNEGSEIIKTHASTTPSGSTITLASTLSFPHSPSTQVRAILFDQVELKTTATVGVIPTGTLAIVGLVADNLETKYNDTKTSSKGYYIARFKNSITAGYSTYSDTVPISGYTNLTARSIIDSALSDINKKTSDVLSDEYAFQQINNCQTEVLREMKRWSFMQSLGTILGNTSAAKWSIAVPTNLDDQNTNKTIWNFRLGTLPNMVWVDKEKWDEITYNVAFTTASSTANAGASTLVLTDSSDFEDSGNFINETDGTSIAYTANNRTTGTLTLTNPLTTAITAGLYVFQNASTGLPQYWTIFGGNIYHYPLTGSSYKNRNYYLDYYKAQTAITSDSDTIVLPDPTIVQYYLQWKFLKKLNNGGDTPESQSAYNQYVLRREKLKQKEVLGKTFRLKPRLNSLDMRGIASDRERINLGNFPDV